MKKIINRAKAPTPKFFKVLRTVGLTLAAVGGTILAAPIALPAIVTTVGGYVAVAGGVLSAASQLTTTEDNILRQAQEDKNGNGQ
ncbi:hypothetical protein B0A78_08865 [Flavobacterium columnare NBRC 100251 = ATCC 23463]|uniref:Uncharacterized protein n=1 Tax=Flavobacterium columnare (strain ATCC 49512 / CIP 103533 / TG 44/87) TaxID=1041826 RepID=G8X4C2_FLACA|nr:hypothetical protein [Flavobacterium columnare]AEW85347.1 hypothetical protein FCOL_02500 [Flavobacterium columnare ATCC 49512]ANO48871.1 hypothetical protein Pf1_00623 [Flavobacterium columnare]APT23650.1 hypothetical protein BU993_11085 [Flavobacterium columnare]PDS23636.1 hypothetical protein B0A78_08865 [Flavobacterium columnare NBRC 100251 = ATCC 23463]